MAGLKLSPTALERLRKNPPTRRVDHTIDNLDGLLLRVPPKPSGRRVWRASFWLRFRYGGDRHWHKINQFPLDGGQEVLATAIDTARSKAREMLADLAAGKNPLAAPTELTFAKFVTEFYGPWVRANHKDPEGTLNRLALFGLDEKPLRAIKLGHIEAWRTKTLAAGRKPATVNRRLNILKAALARAVDWDLLEEHPLKKLKPLRVDRRGVIRFLTPDEEARLLAELEARDATKRAERDSANAWRQKRGYDQLPPLGTYCDDLTPIVLLAVNTGMRRGELWKLRWGDVDLKGGGLTIRGENSKAGQSRHIPLNTTARKVLKTIRGDATPLPNVPVFSAAEFKSAWTRVLRDAEIERFRFHDLRHTFASKLVQAGTDLAVVRELMGHADISMTLRYAHLANRQLTAAVNRIG